MSSRRGHGLRAIATMLSGVTEPVRRQRGRLPAALFARWREIVGPDMAAQTCPEKYVRVCDSGTLVIRVDGPIALEIQHLQPQLIERLNTFLGYQAVHRISIRQGPITGIATHARPPARPPCDPADAVQLAMGNADTPLDVALAGLGQALRRHARLVPTESREGATFNR